MKSLISLFAILALAFAIPSKRDVSLDKLLSIEKELAGMLKTSAQSEEKIETHVKGIMDPSHDQLLTERNIHTDIYRHCCYSYRDRTIKVLLPICIIIQHSCIHPPTLLINSVLCPWFVSV